MPMMNYFHQMKAFRIRKKLCQLAAPEIALWFALMNISNELGQTDRLSLSVSTLMEEAGLSRSGVNRARNVLKQHGFIDWSSRKGNQAALYTFADLTACVPIWNTNRTQPGTQSGTQTEHNLTPYTNGLEQNGLNLKKLFDHHWRSSVRARAKVAQILLDMWPAYTAYADLRTEGKAPHDVICEFMTVGMEPEAIYDVLQNCVHPFSLRYDLFVSALRLGILDVNSKDPAIKANTSKLRSMMFCTPEERAARDKSEVEI